MRFELAIGFDLQPGRALPAASVPAPIAQGVPKERQLCNFAVAVPGGFKRPQPLLLHPTSLRLRLWHAALEPAAVLQCALVRCGPSRRAAGEAGASPASSRDESWGLHTAWKCCAVVLALSARLGSRHPSASIASAPQMLLEAAGAALEPPSLHTGAGGATNGSSSGAAVPLRVGRYRPVVSHMLKANFG